MLTVLLSCDLRVLGDFMFAPALHSDFVSGPLCSEIAVGRIVMLVTLKSMTPSRRCFLLQALLILVRVDDDFVPIFLDVGVSRPQVLKYLVPSVAVN